MSTSAALSVFVLVASGGGLLLSAIQYVRGRDRAVMLLLVPLQLALVIQSVGALFLSGRSAIAASVVSMVLVVPVIVRSTRLIRQRRASKPIVGAR